LRKNIVQTLSDFFHRAWRLACGLPDEPDRTLRPDLPELRRTQWNDEFEELMRARLVMGAFRYGMFSEQTEIRHDNPNSIHDHLVAYVMSGNGEHLVDIANLALVEFTLPSHPKFHFQAIDDGNHHAERVV
jgi:hypothetical protein